MRLWTGRAGSGKTTAVFDEICRHIEISHRPQVLLVPELVSHEYERRLAAVTHNHGAKQAEVLTFHRMANRVFSEAGGLADTGLTAAGRLLVLYEAVRRSSEVLTVYDGALVRPDVLRDLLGVLDEMACGALGPEDFLRVSQELEGHLSAKLRDLGHIGAVYQSLTAELPDPRQELNRVLACLPQCTLFDDADLYFDRFDSFNRQELDIIGVLLGRCASLTVTLTLDPAKPELFVEAATAVARLRACASRAGKTVEPTNFGDCRMDKPVDLAFLERQALLPVTDSHPSDGQSVRLHSARDIFAECEHAAAYIRRTMRETGARRRDFVVTARNFEDYAAALQLVFDRYDVPVFLSEKHDLLQKPVLALVSAALRTVTNGWRYEDMFAYLKTGFASLNPEECDELEGYVQFWHIRGNKWRKEWTGNPEGFAGQLTDGQREQLAHYNELRLRVTEPLMQLERALKGARRAADYVRVLYDFLLRIGADTRISQRADAHQAAGRTQMAEEYLQLWDILMDAMEQFAWVEGDTELDTAAFVSLFHLVLSEYDVGTIPVSMDRVTCGPIDRVCHTGIPHLLVLGVNDGILPAADIGGGVLTDGERETLLGYEIELETGEERMARENAGIYKLLGSPAKTLLLSWCAAGRDANMRPSYLVETVRSLLPGVPESNDAELHESYRLEAERPRFDLACRAAAGDPSDSARAARRAVGDTVQPMSEIRRGPLTQQDAVHGLYGSRVRLTASRVDTYYRCPYRYFLQYGLRLKERRRAAFDAPETGTFLHYVLEHTLRDLEQMGAREREEAHRIADRWVEQYVATMLGGLEQHTARFRYLFRRLTRMLDDILDNILDELAVSDFKPLAFELSFARGGDLPPIPVDGGRLELVGKVDRVDGYVKDGTLYLRVMDYKSGVKKFQLSDLWYGLNLQLLIYLFALNDTAYFRRLLAQDIDSVVPCGALFVPARDPVLSARRDVDEETLRRMREKELRRSGLLVDDPALLEAMEHGMEKDGRFLPVGFKKDGAFTSASLSGLTSLERLGKLHGHIHKVLSQMGEELLAGRTEVHPTRRGPQETACQWCPYGAVCQFDGRMGDKYRAVGGMNTEEFWQQIEDEARREEETQ